MDNLEKLKTSLSNNASNIDDAMNILSIIMDSEDFNKLKKEYIEIFKDVSNKNTIEDITEFINITNKFLNKLHKYDSYINLWTLVDNLNKLNKNAFTDNYNKDTVINSGINLITSLNNLNPEYKDLFDKLINESLNTLFTSIKISSYYNDITLLEQVKKTSFKDYICNKILEESQIQSMNYSSDSINIEQVKSCLDNDPILSTSKKSIELEKLKQEKIENDRNKKLEKLSQDLKKKRIKLFFSKLKLYLSGFGIITLLSFPITIPFIGHKMGKDRSNKILLTKTITATSDLDSKELIESSYKYLEGTTNYTASLKICSPWIINPTGTSYTRTCTVYDYNTDIKEELTKDNIDESKLIKKYSYEETTNTVENLKYLTESQIFITETYQNNEDTIPSDKYTATYTLASLAIFSILYMLEAIIAMQGASDNVTNYLSTLSKEVKEDKENKNSITIELNKVKKLVK